MSSASYSSTTAGKHTPPPLRALAFRSFGPTQIPTGIWITQYDHLAAVRSPCSTKALELAGSKTGQVWPPPLWGGCARLDRPGVAQNSVGLLRRRRRNETQLMMLNVIEM